MPSHDPRAVANEFIRRIGYTPSQMRLQKLVYLAHGWNLAVNKEPLISSRIEAWDNGPVIRQIWNHIKDVGYSDKMLAMRRGSPPISADFSDAESAVIDHVWRKYRDFSAEELSDMTHQEGTPWSNAYFGTGRNAALPQSEIRSHFVELALAGRKAT